METGEGCKGQYEWLLQGFISVKETPGKHRAANEECRQPHAKSGEMPEVLRPFTEKVFPQASWVCMPSNRICEGEEHSEASKRIVHLRD